MTPSLAIDSQMQRNVGRIQCEPGSNTNSFNVSKEPDRKRSLVSLSLRPAAGPSLFPTRNVTVSFLGNDNSNAGSRGNDISEDEALFFKFAPVD